MKIGCIPGLYTGLEHKAALNAIEGAVKSLASDG